MAQKVFEEEKTELKSGAPEVPAVTDDGNARTKMFQLVYRNGHAKWSES